MRAIFPRGRYCFWNPQIPTSGSVQCENNAHSDAQATSTRRSPCPDISMLRLKVSAMPTRMCVFSHARRTPSCAFINIDLRGARGNTTHSFLVSVRYFRTGRENVLDSLSFIGCLRSFCASRGRALRTFRKEVWEFQAQIGSRFKVLCGLSQRAWRNSRSPVRLVLGSSCRLSPHLSPIAEGERAVRWSDVRSARVLA